ADDEPVETEAVGEEIVQTEAVGDEIVETTAVGEEPSHTQLMGRRAEKHVVVEGITGVEEEGVEGQGMGEPDNYGLIPREPPRSRRRAARNRLDLLDYDNLLLRPQPGALMSLCYDILDPETKKRLGTAMEGSASSFLASRRNLTHHVFVRDSAGNELCTV